MLTEQLKILVAPLDWGLGHASRCLSIINELLNQGCSVWLAGHGNSGVLLREAYPHLPYTEINGYNIFYQKAKQKLPVSIALQAFKIRNAIRKEHHILDQLIQQYQFDAVISDNRFGMYSPKTYSVFITHQLAIYSGLNVLADIVVRRMNYGYIHRFNECWIPDFEGSENLAGSLSHPASLPSNASYIGPLSRMKTGDAVMQYDLCIVLSGPEPLRTRWEERLIAGLRGFKGKALLVRGLPLEIQLPEVNEGLSIVNHLPADSLAQALAGAEWILCRSGYSSVMDLIALGKKAIIVPTPGQAEQEYLARYLQQKGYFISVTEQELDIQSAIEAAANFAFQPMPAVDPSQLKKQVQQLIARLREKKE